jgi:N-acetylglucosaminyldiphosphoundecaprenol N-acetyl-beta-D-mannosaminyltransferase
LLDDFDREVYCLGGLPFDAVDMAESLSILKSAARSKTRCFLSTPNLNFLIAAHSDGEFRDSVIHSDLVIADGMPLVWIAKLLRIPILKRVAGSSLFEVFERRRPFFEVLRERRRPSSIPRRLAGSSFLEALREQDAVNPISVYFFGGEDGVAEIAARRINQTKQGLICVGYQSPGFVSVEEMSAASRIEQINASNADFLVVSLGAKKGQAWIYRNLSRIKIPIISHLGAVINFEANKLKRAPVFMQNIGLEWLWRIKEEPELWRRYWHDGAGLLKLLITAVIPHALWLMFNAQYLKKSTNNNIYLKCDETSCRLVISGSVLDPISPEIRSMMRQTALQTTDVELDLTDAEYLSSGFLGLLLLLKKHLDNRAVKLKIVGVQPKMKRLLKWNGLVSFLVT